MIKQVRAYKVDAFIKNNTGGSPTGVVLNATGLTDLQMQFITNELGVSHTAFVFEPIQPEENVTVRFFTPGGEILNCGHGTIAAHFVRAKHFNFIDDQILYQQAKQGVQQIEIIRENQQVTIFLKQNQIQFSSAGVEETTSLLDALAITMDDLADNFPVIIASPGLSRFLLGLKSLDLVNKITPDFEKLKLACHTSKSIGCFIYCLQSVQPWFEATARMFAPGIGVNEDVINGNSSGCLGAYLLQLYGGNNLDLLINQGHTFNCDGVVRVKVKKKDDRLETIIGGCAKIKAEVLVSLNDNF